MKIFNIGITGPWLASLSDHMLALIFASRVSTPAPIQLYLPTVVSQNRGISIQQIATAKPTTISTAKKIAGGFSTGAAVNCSLMLQHCCRNWINSGAAQNCPNHIRRVPGVYSSLVLAAALLRGWSYAQLRVTKNEIVQRRREKFLPWTGMRSRNGLYQLHQERTPIIAKSENNEVASGKLIREGRRRTYWPEFKKR